MDEVSEVSYDTLVLEQTVEDLEGCFIREPSFRLMTCFDSGG